MSSSCWTPMTRSSWSIDDLVEIRKQSAVEEAEPKPEPNKRTVDGFEVNWGGGGLRRTEAGIFVFEDVVI